MSISFVAFIPLVLFPFPITRWKVLGGFHIFVLGEELNRTKLKVREACAVVLRDCLSNTLVALGKDIKGGNTNNYYNDNNYGSLR